MVETPAIHNLKIMRQFYGAVVIEQTKTFEVRLNDRNYKVGDLIIFWEVTGATREETGVKSKPFMITYLLQDFPGIERGYCVFGIEPHALTRAKNDIFVDKEGE